MPKQSVGLWLDFLRLPVADDHAMYVATVEGSIIKSSSATAESQSRMEPIMRFVKNTTSAPMGLTVS
jgi:hypothetical protein